MTHDEPAGFLAFLIFVIIACCLLLVRDRRREPRRPAGRLTVIREHDWLTDALLMDEIGARWYEARLGEVNLFTQRPWITWVLACGVTAFVWAFMTVIWIGRPSERLEGDTAILAALMGVGTVVLLGVAIPLRLVVSGRRNEQSERALEAGMPDAPCPSCGARSWRADGPVRTSQTPVSVKDPDSDSWLERTFECALCRITWSGWFDSDSWRLDEL